MTKRLALVAAVLAVPAMLQSPASAANVAIAVGTGTISGIPTTGCVNNAVFHIDGTAVNAGTDFGPGPYTFAADGSSSSCAGIPSDTGTATLSGNVSGLVTYSRTTGLITLSGNASVNGSSPRPISITCAVVITSAEPITSFAVTCAVTI